MKKNKFLKIHTSRIFVRDEHFVEDVPKQEFVLSYNNMTLNSSLQVDFHISYVSNKIIVRGKIAAQFSSLCDRCLEEFNFPVHLRDVLFHYEVSNKDIIDMTPQVREEIILALPHKSLCTENCKGLCNCCGINLNFDQCTCKMDDDNNIFSKIII